MKIRMKKKSLSVTALIAISSLSLMAVKKDETTTAAAETAPSAEKVSKVDRKPANNPPDLDKKLMNPTLRLFLKAVGITDQSMFRSKEEHPNNSSWTDWYHHTVAKGLGILFLMRKHLDEHNLKDTGTRMVGEEKVVCKDPSAIPPLLRARTADGTCTDPANKTAGAANVRFGRNVPIKVITKKAKFNDAYILGQDADLTPEDKNIMPNPRLVSNTVFAGRSASDEKGTESIKEVTYLNFLATAWIQFMNHDWFSHGDNQKDFTNVMEIPLPKDDPLRSRGLTKLQLFRTAVDPTNAMQPKDYPTSVNTNTHWWDGSQLYGSNQATVDKQRARDPSDSAKMLCEIGMIEKRFPGQGPDGKDLIEQRFPLEPQMENYKQITMERVGFNQNWWVGMSMLHHVFALEHNKLCAALRKDPAIIALNGKPGVNVENVLFDKARLINAALMAKIHTVEWTPAILANKTLRVAMNSNWFGALNMTDKVEPEFAGPLKKALPFLKGSLISGLTGNQTQNHGVPFSLTEEFTSVYRMHSLMREFLPLVDKDGKPILAKNGNADKLIIAKTRLDDSHLVTDRLPMRDIIASFGNAHPGQLVLENYPDFLRNLEIPLIGPVDMAAVDIIRDRERGVLPYNAFRRAINLKRVPSFQELTGVWDIDEAKFKERNPQKIAELDVAREKALTLAKKLFVLYGGKLRNGDLPDNEGQKPIIDKLDLIVGTHAEAIRPNGYGFGETQFQIFVLMASRRLQADRFYTTDYNASVYTKTGIDWIDQKGTMSSVLARNFPGLENALKRPLTENPDGREPISAFNPWFGGNFENGLPKK